MKIWKLSEPFDHRFARASRVGGTWQEGEYKERRRPLTVEWKPDSDVVGDFTWPGLGADVVVSDRVAEALRKANVEGYELREVHMRLDSGPVKRASRKPTVKLPYEGPQLRDLWVTKWIHLNLARSTVIEERRADGTVTYKVSGVERDDATWDQQRKELIRRRHPRADGGGLFVPAVQGVFRVEEVPAWVFCTDDVKVVIEQHGFTNVSFLEMGDVLEA